MRYLTDLQKVGLHNAGRIIEQIFPLRIEGEIDVVEFMSIEKIKDGSASVNHCVFEDIGSVDYCDIYSFYALDPDEPEGKQSVFDNYEDAMRYCLEVLGASPDKWLGEGVIQDAYLEMKSLSP